MFYINCFFVYSILGYLFETGMSFIKKNNFNSGILFGPWTPIYGIGVVLILVLSNLVFDSLNWVKWREVMVMLILVTLVLTFMEWLGGVLIEKIFGVVFWNYENYSLHIGKYIAVEISLCWGILSLFLIYVVHPFLENIIRLIPFYMTLIMIILMFVDYIFTIKKYFKKKE